VNKKIALAAVIVAVPTLMIAGCSAKQLEPLQDSQINERNMAPATVGSMPDGFSNWAAKCDGPNMVYVLFHSDAAYGSIDVVPNDPRCEG